MIIYKITNLLLNKCYIGQTRRPIRFRWNVHTCSKTKSLISSAIQKYGKENFKIEIIDNANTQEELNKLESYYIKKYNSLAPNGYNLTSGGDCNFKMSKDISNKLSNLFKGKKLSEKTKSLISKAISGKPKSITQAEATRKSHINRYNPLRKSIYGYNPTTQEGIFIRCASDAKCLGFTPILIKRCCNKLKGYSNHKGFIWNWHAN